MNIRAKFVVQEITTTNWGGTKVLMRPEYDEKLAEDQSYAKATPSGELWMQVDNPIALNELTLGRKFYLDFIPVQTNG
jgi:hypothetical protein